MTWYADLIGKPFSEDDGLGPRAFHCWGLVRHIYRERLAIDLPTYGEIDARNMARVSRTMEHGSTNGPWVICKQPKPYDVVLMRLLHSRRVSHVGVMISERDMIHVEAATSVAVVPISHYSVSGRIVGFARHVPWEL